MTPPPDLPLAPRDLLILSVLAEGPLHGYGIIRANLYRVLRPMTRYAWIEEAEDEAWDAVRRRTYRITRTGGVVLRAEVSRLERLLGHGRPALAGGGRRGSA